MTIETRNAVIRNASISIEDPGFLTANLTLDYGGSQQGFGGLVLCVSPDSEHWPGDSNYAGVFITRVLEVVGVSDWSDLVGKTIRARCERTKVHEIGHIIQDKWFNPSAEFSAIKSAKP